LLYFIQPATIRKRAIKENQMNTTLIPNANWQTQQRGTNDQEYQIYLSCADDGKGGDITRNGQPLKSYEEWLNS
jgi:hypothetical protein